MGKFLGKFVGKLGWILAYILAMPIILTYVSIVTVLNIFRIVFTSKVWVVDVHTEGLQEAVVNYEE